MLCYPLEQKRLDRWAGPVLGQFKVDGERCRALFDTMRRMWRLWSSYLNEFFTVPHINAALLGLPENLEFDGELYRHGWDFNKIHSVVSTRRGDNLHPDCEEIKFHVFDIANLSDIQLGRTNKLIEVAKSFPSELELVPTHIVTGMEQIMELYQGFVDRGYEGIIIRHLENLYIRRRSIWVMKFKPKKKDQYKIVQVLEAISKDGVPKGLAGSIECIDDMGTTFGVSPGLGWKEPRKRELWTRREEVKSLWCEVGYQNIISGSGIPRFATFLDIFERGLTGIKVLDF